MSRPFLNYTTMARSRNIKPGFFLNEQLVELPFSTRLLFAGLWTLADREGRLEDRPKKIKMAIFPADNVDVDGALQELHSANLVLRYIVDNKRFIQINNFLKHQNPHVNEAASVIPAPEEHRTSTVPIGPLTSSLIPDSLLLIPDPLVPITGVVTPRTKKNVKGSRINDSFIVTDEMKAWFDQKGFSIDIDIETEKFINYWKARSGQQSLKQDWVATWRNWMLNAQDYRGGFPAAKAPVDENDRKAREIVRKSQEMFYAGFEKRS